MCYGIGELNHRLKFLRTNEYVPIPNRLQEALSDESKMDHFYIGNETMKNIHDDLNAIDTRWKTRSRIQKEIHHEVLSCAAPLIYKSSYKSHQKLILEYNRFEKCLAGIFVKMPRRAGKTEAIAQIMAVLMKNIPNLIISIVAPAGRQAKGRAGIKSLILEILRNALDVDVHNTEECLLYTPSEGDTRKIFAFPGGSPDTYVILEIGK